MKTFSIRQSARVHAKNMVMCNFYIFSIFVLLVFDTIPTVGSLFDCIVGLPEKHAHGVISMFQGGSSDKNGYLLHYIPLAPVSDSVSGRVVQYIGLKLITVTM